MTKRAHNDRIAEILSAPYARVLRREAEGGYSAEVIEFPGCFSAGDTAEETMANLDEAMTLWLEGELADGHDIPVPLAPTESASAAGHAASRVRHRGAP